VHHDYLATTATSFSPVLCPSRFYPPTPPTPSPFSCLLHHLLIPSSVSTLRSHLLVSEVSVLVAVFSLFFHRSFLKATSLSNFLSLLDEYRITDERRRMHTVKSRVTLDRFLNHHWIHQRFFKCCQASPTELTSTILTTQPCGYSCFTRIVNVSEYLTKM